MDKKLIPISTLGIPVVESPIYLQKGEVTIELYNNPSYKDMIDTIQWAVNLIVDNRPFISYPMKTIFCDLALVKVFTNLNVSIPAGATENDIYLIYEAVTRAQIIEDITSKADKDRVAFLVDGISKTLDSILAYRNSARGVINILAAEADDNSKVFAKALEMYSDEGNLQEISKLMKMVETLGKPQQ